MPAPVIREELLTFLNVPLVERLDVKEGGDPEAVGHLTMSA